MSTIFDHHVLDHNYDSAYWSRSEAGNMRYDIFESFNGTLAIIIMFMGAVLLISLLVTSYYGILEKDQYSAYL